MPQSEMQRLDDERKFFIGLALSAVAFGMADLAVVYMDTAGRRQISIHCELAQRWDH